MVQGAREQQVSASGGLEIGYSTNRPDLAAPADRRRFGHYARRRGLRFEIADPRRRYDLVISNSGGPLDEWSRLPTGTRLVLDLVDSYLAVRRTDPVAAVRGLVKFLFRRTRRLHLDYTRLIEDTCRRADAVICTTEEQRRDILAYCPNVHVILDFQPEATTRVKTDYARGDTFHLVWEGLPWNLTTFSVVADALAQLKRRHRIELHLLTDLDWPLLFGDMLKVSTQSRVRSILPLPDVHLYQWNRHLLAPLSTACDLAIIPIPLDQPFFAGKPENKLVMFWRMGMPVVTSATPAYERAMKGAGLPMTCRTTEDWVRVLERYMDDEAARREAGERGRAYAESHWSEESLVSQWDAVFDSVGAGRSGSPLPVGA
jgi:glycosyltransferase involved in cell wall biosynthesis